jgi:3-oxoacyl-[acyl-carrier protein] reductase
MGKKVVVITGGGIGIGRACAYAFYKVGYHVIVTDVLEKEGRQVADELERCGGSAEFHSLDVRSTQQANTVVADIEKKHGALDVVLANAGIAHKTPLADPQRREMGVNTRR